MNHFHRFAPFAAACALILGVSTASSNNGMEFVEFPFEQTLFIDCLEEDVYMFETVSFRMHEFVTPSGSEHFAIAVDISGYLVGLTSGYTWDIQKLAGAQQFNVRKGLITQLVFQGVAKPTSPGAPMLSWHSNGKTTVTANGNLVVFNPNDGGSKVRCIWKK